MFSYKKIRGVIFFLLLIFSSFSVYAVGLSPAIGSAEFYPGFDESIKYTVRGNSQSNSKIVMGVSGPLSSYVTLDKDTVSVSPGEVAFFNARVVIPDNHGLVGPQPFYIDVNEIADADDDRMIVVTTGVQGRFTVYFPYPGKYLDITALSVPHIGQGDNTGYDWVVKSRGGESVTFDAVLTLYDSQNKSMTSKTYSGITLVPQQEYSGKGSFDTRTAEPGQYGVNLTINYDGVEKSTVTTYNIGEESIDLVSYYPINLTMGEINSITIVVKSLWNLRIDNVYAKIDIPGATTTTQTIQLNPFDTISISQYINVPAFEETKEIPANITVFFNGKQREFQAKFLLVESKSDESSGNLVQIVIIIGAILFLIMLVLIVLLVKGQKKKKN